MEKGSDRTNCRFPAKKWADICGKNPRGMRKLYETYEYLSLFIFIRYDKHMNIISNSYQYELNNNCVSYEYHIDINCPNLLKYRDEYSKKSGVCPDNDRSDAGQSPEQDRETETDINILQNEFADEVEFYLTKKKRKLSGKRLKTFERFWISFDYKKGRAEAADSWIDIPQLTEKLVNEICIAAEAEAKKRPGLIQSGKTPKMAQGWLTGRRWEDEEFKEGSSKSSTLTAMPGAIIV